MSAEKNWQFELEEYIKQGEPGQIEKSEAWQTAIGLQAVDGLKTSAGNRCKIGSAAGFSHYEYASGSGAEAGGIHDGCKK